MLIPGHSIIDNNILKWARRWYFWNNELGMAEGPFHNKIICITKFKQYYSKAFR